MFRIRLLGTPHLAGPKGGVPQGPRRLAILACLAAAGPAGLTRDKLIARLWPETDEERARRNLSQLLYAMRTELGVDLVEGTGTVRLAAGQCTCDVLEFDAAITARDDVAALQAYGGPFLDGFHLTESSEFSQWADTERERRADLARMAAVRLAESAAGEDRIAAWQRVVALDPLSAPPTLRLMEAFAARGDRTAAVRVAEKHAALLKAELDTAADPAILRRAAELRAAPVDAAADAPSAAHPEANAASTSHAAAAVAAPGGAPREAAVGERVAAETRAGEARPAGSTTARERPLALVAGLVGLTVLGLLAWSQRAPARLLPDEYVIIAEFVNRSGDSLLTHSVGAAAKAALQQSAHVVPLPRARVRRALARMQLQDSTDRLDPTLALEVAQREGVRFVLSGEVLAVGDRRQVVSHIIEASTGREVVTRSFDAQNDDAILEAVDRLAAAMRRDLGEARATVATARPLPDVTTRSLPALQAYAMAIDADVREDADAYPNLLLRAVALDSNFASAHAKLGELYAFNNDVPNSARHFRRALELAEGLPIEEALRIRISAAWARGDRNTTVQLSRTYLSLRPRDSGAWARLGYAYFSAGQSAEARAAYRVADSLQPLTAGSVLNVGTSWLTTARMSGDRAHFDSARAWYGRAFAEIPDQQYAIFYNQQYGTILIGAGFPDSARATFERMARRGPLDRARGLRSLAFLDLLEGHWRDAAGNFATAGELSQQQRQPTSVVRNDALLAEAYLFTGDRDRALAALRRPAAVVLREPIEARAIAFVALAQVRAGDLTGARRLLGRMRAISRPEHDGEQAALGGVEGAIALAEGRADEAFRLLDAAFVRDSANVQLRMLRARTLEAVGRDGDAEQAWKRNAEHFEFGLEGQLDWQFSLYERARLLERLGRPEEAAAALRALVARFPSSAEPDPPTLADARARLRRLEAGPGAR
ncbi:MAG: hypothetical protein K1X31_13665 [Gemmatimonadaceae bacterium]|nr:hypothetical protein [Gemmatimonadaceae bacterium]